LNPWAATTIQPWNKFMFKSMPLALRIQTLLFLLVALIIALGTFLSYQFSIRTLRAETVAALQASTASRASYESGPFTDAQRNTTSLQIEYLRRLEQAGNTDPQAEFDAWFVRYKDGVVRVRPERDDHKRQSSVYIRPQINLDADVRRNVLVAFKLLNEWGPAMTHNYYSAYIDLPGVGLIMFSPSVNWGKEADANTNNFDYPPVQSAAPAKNPGRKTGWSEIYFDDKAGIWMLSAITPIDRAGKWIAAVSQDIGVDELVKRTTNEFAPGTYNMIVEAGGSLVAHPDLMEKIHKSNGNLKIASLGDAQLEGFVREAALARGGTEVRESPDGEHLLAISHIRGPGWLFITVYPKSLMEAKAYAAAQDIVLVGLILLLVEWLFLSWIIRRQVSQPLAELSRAAASVAMGNMDVELHVQGQDELGQLGTRFIDMAARVLERDLALNQRADELEYEVSERKLAEQRMSFMATHDELTGLANRSLLMDRLGQALSIAKRNDGLLALLFIDLDRFKHINDTLGHDIGDQVLKQVASKISLLLRKSDTLCRLGGDEFVLLLPTVHSQDDAALIANKIITALAEIKGIGGLNFPVTSCIGISTFPNDGSDGDTLLRNADIAMYRAKVAGRNRYQSYTHDMGQRAVEALQLDAAIRQALQRNEFVLQFQPKVNSLGNKMVGAEALLRWARPGHGLLMPDAFLPYAQEHRLMAGIDSDVLNRACAHLAEWHLAGCKIESLSVNLSAGFFARIDMQKELQGVLEKHPIEPRWLTLEVTEGALLQDGDIVADNLKALRRLGIRISVDDFGTGFSSLSYLHRFPIDELKIDRSFVNAITSAQDDVPLVKAIIRIGHDLKLSVVAEGVETTAQVEYLRREGCDELQGYFFYRPMAEEDFRKLLF
jgi:diguanylate cyclase (GGDEF)-like protein